MLQYKPHNAEVITRPAEFDELLQGNAPGIYIAKSRVIFEKVEQQLSPCTPLNTYMPSSKIGSITLLEAAVMASLIRLLKPRRIFEFGTFLGYSTALFLRNSEAPCQVWSVDLDTDQRELAQFSSISEEARLNDDAQNDNYLRFMQASQGERYLRELESSQQQRLHLLKQNSTTLDTVALDLTAQVDFIFIDGGHDLDTIASDTDNAMRMLGENGVCLWHDFNSPLHHEVTEFLTSWSEGYQLIHIESTMLALLLSPGAARLLAGGELKP